MVEFKEVHRRFGSSALLPTTRECTGSAGYDSSCDSSCDSSWLSHGANCSKVGGGDSFRREGIISLAVLLQFFYRFGSMSLNATTQGFLKEVESSTGFKVLVEEQGSQLQAPLLAKVQVARRGMPFHRVVYHPSAWGNGRLSGLLPVLLHPSFAQSASGSAV
jgi:hypothetical protein